MKSIAAFVTFLALALITSLHAADDRTSRMLRKADEVLRQVQVVSNTAVGYAGECPEANWALSVICASDEEAVSRLVELSEQCQPAGFVMCLLGLRTLDAKRFSIELEKRREQILEAKLMVETAVGCFREKRPALEVLEEKAWSRDWLICSPIPELWDTIRVEPIVDGFEKEANQALQPTRMLVTFHAYAWPAPSTRVADL